MTRSYKKYPGGGYCGGSEKQDKQIWHRRDRRCAKAHLNKNYEDEDITFKTKNEVSNVWDMKKDGKAYYGHYDPDEGFWTHGVNRKWITIWDSWYEYFRRCLRK